MAAPRYRKKPNRLPGHDYRQPGTYFVTLCTEGRHCLFGEVIDGEMAHSDIGAMVQEEWHALPGTYPSVALDALMLMPDHLHAVIVLGADPRVDRSMPLGDIVKAFKGKSTNRYLAQARSGIWPRLDRRLWQQRYFDRVIRNDVELERIRAYIAGNPVRWEQRRRGEP